MKRTTLLSLCSLTLAAAGCGSGDEPTLPEPAELAQVTSALCTDVGAANYSAALGSIEGSTVTSTSPSNTYGSAACPSRYVVEATSTFGKDLHVWATWAEGLPSTQSACESVPKLNATAYGYSLFTNSWVVIGSQTVGGTWQPFFGGGFCSIGAGWDLTNTTYTKVRIATKAYQDTIFGTYYRKVTGTIEIPDIPA